MASFCPCCWSAVRQGLYGQGLMSETVVVRPRFDVRDSSCMAKVCCQRQRLYGQDLMSETVVVRPRFDVRDSGCTAKV